MNTIIDIKNLRYTTNMAAWKLKRRWFEAIEKNKNEDEKKNFVLKEYNQCRKDFIKNNLSDSYMTFEEFYADKIKSLEKWASNKKYNVTEYPYLEELSEFKSTFDSIVDADAFIKFAAMSWVIGNPDDLRNNYNNYYMYFNSSNDKAIFIPYDYDRCFGIMKDWEVHMEEIPCFTTKQIS